MCKWTYRLRKVSKERGLSTDLQYTLELRLGVITLVRTFENAFLLWSLLIDAWIEIYAETCTQSIHSTLTLKL